MRQSGYWLVIPVNIVSALISMREMINDLNIFYFLSVIKKFTTKIVKLNNILNILFGAGLGPFNMGAQIPNVHNDAYQTWLIVFLFK